MRKRVIAHSMHETEADEIRPYLRDVEETESFLTGTIDTDVIDTLRKAGHLIEVIPDTPSLHTRVRTFAAGQGAFLRASAPTGSLLESSEVAPQVYLMELWGPLLPDHRALLDGIGVQILEYIPHNTYSVRVTSESASRAEDLPFVREMIRDDGEETGTVLSFGVAEDAAGDNVVDDQSEAKVYDIILHDASALESLIAWLRERGVEPVASKGRKLRLRAREDSPLLEEVAGLYEVLQVEEYRPPKLYNDVARRLVCLEVAQSPPARVVELRGERQRIGIADTGVDAKHPDLQSRVKKLIPRVPGTDGIDQHGHGTHVAATAAGDGSAYGDHSMAGMAPGAEIVFQSLGPKGELSGLPLDLGDLFQEAYDQGVRIHNNSWGADTRSLYTLNASEVDAFVAEHRDMLVVIAAGNDAVGEPCRNVQQGYVDWLSIGSPATAKNALVVGAQRSSRTVGGYSQRTYGALWGERFPHPPTYEQKVSGDPEQLAAFSSRGPCDDRRVKPDLVAPGTDILSARAAQAPVENFWGVHDEHYAYMGGTSMAAPVVSGCAALVREYYERVRNHEPSAALLKATLVCGTRRLTGSDATHGQPELPNYHQGFGAVDLRTTLPNRVEPKFRLAFRDGWQDPARRLSRTGKRARFRVKVREGMPLRICLCWTDPPARALQNLLSLLVETPDHTKRTGNDLFTPNPSPTDRDNNVQVVRLEDPLAGLYIIQVSALNLIVPDQDFALVVTGALDSELDDYLGM